jgi:hypothetical protein
MDFDKILETLRGCNRPAFFETTARGTLAKGKPQYDQNCGFGCVGALHKDPLQKLSLKGLPTTSKSYWWVKYPTRALKEIEKMHANTNAALRCFGGKLIWDEVIRDNFGTQFFISIEAEDYPHKMPKAFVKEAEIKFKHAKHMYRDGSLCLMHHNDYNSSISILEIRNLACAWCWAVEVYTHTKEWPAAQAD